MFVEMQPSDVGKIQFSDLYSRFISTSQTTKATLTDVQ